jgi:predicted RNA-binding protein with PIN domain
VGKGGVLWSTGVVNEHSSADGAQVDVMVVDGANVVGSRPDGWWSDRPGAAARLHAQLLDAPTLAQRVVLVLEGRARVGVPEAVTGALQVVHAPGEGDDTMVEEVERATTAGRTVAVVTADRGLAARVEHLGARRLRPGWLLNHLERPSPGLENGADRD